MSYLVIAIIIVILFSLGSALLGMLRGGKEGSEKMFKSLRLRIGLSVLLFALLMLAGAMGWIEPNTTMLPTQ
ncbi:MAG: twin transmembrane helix small protein [Gammaproteobacteria bacterium]|nr:twin transmembrane helix small protein [Gammaproteobacteria bacterium]